MEKKFRFSNMHADFQARDAKAVFGLALLAPHHLQGGRRAPSSSIWTTTSTTTSPPA